MASNCNKYLEPTGVVLGKSTRVLGKVTLTTDGTYDSTKEYDRISLVYDPNTYISYISKQHVPAGTALSNTEYWQPLNSAILGPGQSLSGILNMLNSLDLPSVSGFLHYNEDNNSLEWVDVEQLIEIINNSGLELSLNEPLKSINSLNTSATQAGQMLIYNGTQWKLDKITNIPTALGEPLKSIATLSTPSGTNKIIVYKNGSWSYQDASSINLGSLLTHINTKNAPVPTTSGYLYYNGSAYSWATGTNTPGPSILNELLSKLNTVALPGNVQRYLYWNGLGFEWRTGTSATDWSNITNKPTSLIGYGITANDTLLSGLSGRISSLESKVPVTLREPILGINSMINNTPSVGDILVYRSTGWVFEQKPGYNPDPGTDDPQNPYPWLDDWKATVDGLISGLQSDLGTLRTTLNGRIDSTRSEIENWVRGLLDNETPWWLSDDPEMLDQIQAWSGWDTALQGWAQYVGILGSDGSKQIASLTTRVNAIEGLVEALDPDNPDGIAALKTSIQTYIDEVDGVKSAIANLGTQYALLNNENSEILLWTAAKMRAISNQFGSDVTIEALMEDAWGRRIAGIETNVSDLQTQYGNIQDAYNTVYAQLTDITGLTGSSTLVTKVRAVDGRLTTVEGNLVSAFGENFAAAITKSNLNEQVAGLIASGANDTRAAILAAVQGDESTVAILADKVKIGLNDDLLSTGIDIENNQITLYGNTLINGMLTLNSDEGFILNNADGSPGTVIRGGEIPSYTQWTNGNSGQVNRSTDNHWVGVNNGSYSDSCSIDLGNYFNGNDVTINTIVITSGIPLSGTLICKLKAYHGTDVVTKTITVDGNSLISNSPFRYAINVSDFSHSLTEDSNIIVSFDLSGTTTHTDDFQLNIAALATIEGANIGYIGSNGIALRAASVYDGPNYSYFGTALACIVHGQYGIKVGYDGITYSTDKGVTWTSLI